MSLGNLDANGLGRYDNPHNTTGLSFAGLLNLGLAAVSGVITTIRSRLATLEGGAWESLTLSASWVNYGSGYGSARYRKIGNRVQVAGLIKSGTTTVGTTIATLPVGFRPSSQEIYTAHNGTSGARALQVGTNGTIVIAGLAVSNAELSLANITFLVD